MPKPILTLAQKERALAFMWSEKARLGTKAAVADRIGCKRAAVSMVMDGSYPARPDGILLAALNRIDRRLCPFLGMEIEPVHCIEANAGPVPTWDPAALSQRRACQTCHHRPSTDPKAA